MPELDWVKRGKIYKANKKKPGQQSQRKKNRGGGKKREKIAITLLLRGLVHVGKEQKKKVGGPGTSRTIEMN